MTEVCSCKMVFSMNNDQVCAIYPLLSTVAIFYVIIHSIVDGRTSVI